MKVKQTVHLKVEVVEDGSTAVITLLDSESRDLESQVIYYGGNNTSSAGEVVKQFIKRSAYLESKS